jgi:hypothetical protein
MNISQQSYLAAKIVNIIKIIVFKAAIIHDFLKNTKVLKSSLLVNYANNTRFNYNSKSKNY